MKKHRNHDDDDDDYEPVFRHTAGLGHRLKGNLQQFVLFAVIVGTSVLVAWMYAQ